MFQIKVPLNLFVMFGQTLSWFRKILQQFQNDQLRLIFVNNSYLKCLKLYTVRVQAKLRPRSNCNL